MSKLDAVLSHLDADQDAALARLFELLKFQSISTDPAYKADCRSAAEWLVADLEAIGFEASVRDTPGHPMVVGHQKGPEGAPHLLFYGHYDVQPVDPLELWDRAPFEPAIETRDDGTQLIRGRGTADDKGQLMTFVEACRAWKAKTGALPCSVTILFEGEEESGSPSLTPFLEANREELTCDLALVCDTGMWDRDTPAINVTLRGLLGEEVILTAADRDLHSGSYGGPAANPIRILSKILAGLHDDQGRVTLPGFYDGVGEPSDAIKAQWDALGFDPDAFLGEVDLSNPAGEAGRTVLEQIWSRPTLEFNGVTGGYTGQGFKTVLPAQASAKVSCRLVGDQDPHAIRSAFRTYVRDNLPPDCDVEFLEHGASGATVLPHESPAYEAARGALSLEWGKEAAFIGGGGSIPIVGHFQSILDMDSLMVGFGLDDDRIHSPNEKYELQSFQKGARSWARILAALAE